MEERIENEKKLIEWCWLNLEFNNNPDTWEDTYIVDILNGYNGTCHIASGGTIKYSEIRYNFGL